MNELTHTLVRLDDVGLTLADPADDLRGRTVMDLNGDEVGKVDGLLIDEDEQRVSSLESARAVSSGSARRSG